MISIIIPVYNGAATISSCLDHLENCDYPKEQYEVIVVDNNSTDNTKDIIKKHNVKYYLETIKGQAAARNLGARMAEGEILGFIDADCLVDKKWISEVEKTFKNRNVAAIVGLREHLTRNIYDEMQSLDYQKYWERELSSGKPLNKICGSNSAIRKEVFEELKGYDTQFITYQDIELGFRIVHCGYHIEYAPNARVKHIYLDTFDSLFSKTMKHGFSEYLCFYKHRNDPGIEYLMPSFGRFYFRFLEKSQNRLILRSMIGAIDITTPFFRWTVKKLLDHNIRIYFLYKTLLNLSLFKGKLLAILNVA